MNFFFNFVFVAIISFFFHFLCCIQLEPIFLFFPYIMNEVPQLGYQSDQTQTLINWKQCILCQEDTKTKGPLVLHPRAGSYHSLLEAIKERAILQDVGCVQIQRRLKETTEKMLLASNAVWHRTCYSNATKKVKIARDSIHKQDVLSTGSHFGKQRGRKRKRLGIDEPSTSSESPFTRSSTSPLNNSLCFFLSTGCQPGTVD